MKKLNRKGFTLIELLAIIVILAIIMVVTIPSVLNMMGDTTKTQLKNSADAIEKWVTEQHGYAVTGLAGASTAYTNICGTNGGTCAAGAVEVDVVNDADNTDDDNYAKGKNFIEAAGQEVTNYSSLTVQILANGRACIKVKGAGQFSSVTDEISSGGC